MLTYNNPRSTLPFPSFHHLASSVTPTRRLCLVIRHKDMNLVMNLSGFDRSSCSKRAVLGLCGCGMRNGRVGVIVKCNVRGGNWDLEGEILEFMKRSRKPAAFPSKKELIEAGRMDLVTGIEREGGWLALGWDVEDEVVGCSGNVVKEWDAIVGRQCEVLERRFEAGSVNGSMGFGSESLTALSSSAGPLDEATGIAGILSRLEKERSTAFGVTKKERELIDHAISDSIGENQGAKTLGSPSNMTVAGHDRRSDRGTENYQATRSEDTGTADFKDTSNNPSPDMWRAWIKQGAAAHTSFNMKSDVETDNVLLYKSHSTREGKNKTVDGKNGSSGHDYSPDFIRTRLRTLELELSTALLSIKSKSDESTVSKASKDQSEEMQNLSDAWEFQQTEIMHAKDALRSIRAKLAVLEGRMTMTTIDAQRMVEVKQKKIDYARHALQLLRTIPIIWPNSAATVLLSGSFDGWTTQTKMEKSTSGIHSISLKLYPGTYEFKFIVDGVWKIDPLRPITLTNGFENNLLIVK